MLNPHKRKIKTVLSFIIIKMQELKETPLTPQETHAILFYADIMHLNTYGRPITFDTYRTSDRGIEAIYVSKIIGLDVEYDWDYLSKTDKTILEDTINKHLAIRDVPMLSIALAAKRHIAYRLAEANDPGPQIINIEHMLNKSVSTTQKAEIIDYVYMINQRSNSKA